jgi:hypothetical protein
MFAPRDLRLICFPTADLSFREDVDRALADLPREGTPAELRDRLLATLRPWYRAVEIAFQDELAQLEMQPTRIWYVYRDGRVLPPDERRERLYAALASARRTFDASRMAVADALDAARAVGYAESEVDVEGARFDEGPGRDGDGPDDGSPRRRTTSSV